ncbi:phosphate acyltransferase PlsX [Phreatobacter aquaticus]|uniref:Phosphate acyltransferase n=1 Tax=Phreatobacter aquaticus TaxID=2570229 RepID=A0A4D7QJC8_9HYPH|nr:phosphate acyltransferase PlsX [Phreatobacter aquaticus]QCK87175.1 phosphate acyltransferase PlsX [Phreatobacter aquaticus]
MSEKVRLALDVMGGDFGPSVVIPGAEIALSRHKDMEFVLVGDERQIMPLLAANPRVKARSEIVHTDIAIRMDDKPSKALRYGRRVSSMWKALDEVKFGRAAAAVSAGNTGALMAMAAFNLKTMPGIERPALAALWPTLKGESIVLDMGASIGADAAALFDMAVMGAAMARVVFDIERPTVGLLNIGVEEVKGLEFIREAGQMLRDADLADLDYRGFVEGDDIGKGTVEVVVTEGFTGNIALKTGEGTARQIGEYLRAAMSRTWRSRLGYLLARNAFATLREKMDPRKSNGAVFLGLNGVVVKSHGGTDPIGFASAVDVAYDMARYDLQSKIRTMVDVSHAARKDPTAAPVEAAS